MADKRSRRKSGMTLDDAWLKEAYKAGLDQLQASEELVKTTLEKCRTEIGNMEKNKKVPSHRAFPSYMLKFGAPVAACLLVLVLMLNFPGLIRRKNLTESAIPQVSVATGEGEEPVVIKSGAPRDPSKVSIKFSESVSIDGIGQDQNAYANEANNTSDNAIINNTNASNDDTNVSEDASGGTNKRGLGSLPYPKQENVLKSAGFSYVQTLRGENMPHDVAVAVTEAYNSANGTEYTLYKNKVLDIHILKSDGIGALNLRNANSFDDLLEEKQYHMLPLHDSGMTILLPVVESEVIYENPEDAPYDIVYNKDGRTWLSSAYFGITTEHSHAEYLLNKDGHLRLVKEEFNAEQVTGYMIVDIGNGRDFVIVIKTEGMEYAIPCFVNGYSDRLENYRVYPAREVMDALAVYLEGS